MTATPTEMDVADLLLAHDLPAATDAAVALGQSQILADMATGIVPRTVRAFSTLHEYVDANEYAGLCGPVYDALRGDGDDFPETLTDFANAVQDRLHVWLDTRP